MDVRDKKTGSWMPEIISGFFVYRCSNCDHVVREWHKKCPKCKQVNFIRWTGKAAQNG